MRAIEFLIDAGGQAAGTLPLKGLTYKNAETYIRERLPNGPAFLDDSRNQNFKDKFNNAQTATINATRIRKDMPVINGHQVTEFQERLKAGNLDVNKPFTDPKDYSKDGDNSWPLGSPQRILPTDPFPEGLKGDAADAFLERGLIDGDNSDDKITVGTIPKKAGTLIPLQGQIFFDKSISKLVENGIDGTASFLAAGKNNNLITSADNYLIDGHHRWLQAMLIDSNLEISTISIDLPIAKLLPLSLAYGDALGNPRNKS